MDISVVKIKFINELNLNDGGKELRKLMKPSWGLISYAII